MIINYWLVLSDAFRDEIEGVIGADIFTPAVMAISYPELNNLSGVLLNSLKNAPSRDAVSYSVVPGTRVWSGYASVDYLGDMVPVRELFQALETKYYPDFYVGGMWDFHTGESIGGVGAPWFSTPAELDGVLGGAVKDINLNAGQAERKFV